MNKLLPENIESERALLHQLVGWCEGVRAAREILEPQDFSRTGHQEIFAMLCRFDDQGRYWTPSLLCDAFANHPDGARVQNLISELGPFWLLRDTGPVKHFAKIILENSVRRDCIKAAVDFYDQSTNPLGTFTAIGEIVGRIVKRLEGISHDKP